MMHKEAAEVVRSAPVQTSDNVPPSCAARVMASHHAECPWAGIWYNLDCHAQILQNAHFGMATALRLGPPPDAGPRSCPSARATRAKRAITHWRGTLSVANTVVPSWNTSCCPVQTEQTDPPGWRTRRHGKTCLTTNLSPGVPYWMLSPASLGSCNNSGKTSVCDACMENVTTKARRNLGSLRVRVSWRNRRDTVRPCDRWSLRRVGDWAAAIALGSRVAAQGACERPVSAALLSKKVWSACFLSFPSGGALLSTLM